MASISTLATADTELCADAVAFCPSSSTLLACGCYELLPGEPSRRVGRLTLLSTLGDRLDTLQQVGDDGVLDCAWAPPRAGRPQLLATASSTGHARLLRLESTADTAAGACADPTRPRLEPCSASECVDAGVCMALDWGEDAAGASARLALSSTAGRLYVLDGSPAGLVPLLAWQAHDLEGWAVAFDRAEGANTLYSGADDGVLKRWDLRCDPAATPAATATNRRSHRAGVCCVSPSPSDTTLVASGSYDEMMRLWDVRTLREPLHELACGGGVWRLRWHPHHPRMILGACMHAGFKVISLGADGAPSEHASYTEHGTGKALAYGADWARDEPVRHDGVDSGDVGSAASSAVYRAATCSFYDRALHLWSVGVAAATG